MKTKKSYKLLLIAFMLSFCFFIPTVNMDVKATTVYVTPTGSKYHTHACGRGSYSPTSLANAQSMGLEPCMKCFPGGAPRDTTSISSSKQSQASSSNSSYTSAFKLNHKSKVLVVGQTCKLKVKHATGTPHWSSSNKKIASVKSNGLVTAKKKGKATITVQVNGEKKTCKIIVEKPHLSHKNLTMNEDDDELDLYMKGCSHEAKWSSSDENIMEISADSFYIDQPGTVIVTASVHGKKYKCKIKIEASQEDEIEEPDLEDDNVD